MFSENSSVDFARVKNEQTVKNAEVSKKCYQRASKRAMMIYVKLCNFAEWLIGRREHCEEMVSAIDAFGNDGSFRL